MKSENYYAANPDLSFYYERVIDWDRLVPLFAEGDDADAAGRDRRPAGARCWRSRASTSARRSRLARRSRSTRHAAQGRHQGLAADGREPARPGGPGADRAGRSARARRRRHAVHRPPAVFEMLARADASTMVQYAFYTSPAAMIVRFGTDEQKRSGCRARQRRDHRLGRDDRARGWLGRRQRQHVGHPPARRHAGASTAASSSSRAATARSASCSRARCTAPRDWMGWGCSSCRAALGEQGELRDRARRGEGVHQRLADLCACRSTTAAPRSWASWARAGAASRRS